MSYSVLTPALVPEAAAARKKPNVGDPLILDAVEELIGEPAAPNRRYSTWQALSPGDVEEINTTKALVLAGANPLHDEYRIAPGLSLELLRRIRVPILPMGVGLYGDDTREVRMSDTTRDMLRAIHERIELSSWRCPRTLAYLRRHLPELEPKLSMTSCPVVHAGRGTRSAAPVDPASGSVAVTVTERGPGWWERESRILALVRRAFPGRRRVLVLHQQFERSRSNRFARRWFPARFGGPPDFHALAERDGMQIARPRTTDELRAAYRETSVHVGSRLHAHLYFLSQNKPSYLFAVDGRAAGFADSLRFPLLDGSERALDSLCDFGAVQTEIAALWRGPMTRFLESVRKHIA